MLSACTALHASPPNSTQLNRPCSIHQPTQPHPPEPPLLMPSELRLERDSWLSRWLPWLRVRLSAEARAPLRPVSAEERRSDAPAMRSPDSFHTNRKASPMFLLAAPPCSATCLWEGRGWGSA